MATKTKGKWQSRAVLRLIEPGSSVDCAHCGERVKFQARLRLQQVICNVYVKNVWDRVEHYHSECYELAGSPHGEPAERLSHSADRVDHDGGERSRSAVARP